MNGMHYLFRRISRSYGYSALIVVTIALALGVNLGVFSVTRSILNHSLGVPDADRVVHYTIDTERQKLNFSGPAYNALINNAHMNNLLAWKKAQFRLKSQDSVVKIGGALVTGNAFSVFGLKPSLGRFFNESDDLPGGGKDGWLAVLGYSYWKTSFDANPNVIGQVIYVEGVPVHIIGVLPREFTGISPLSATDILLPRHFLDVTNPNENRFANPGYFEWMVFGRLARGVSIPSVQSNLNAIDSSFRRSADPEGMMFSSDSPANSPQAALLHVEDGSLGASSSGKALHLPLLSMEILTVFVFLSCLSNLALLIIGRAKREAHNDTIRAALGARLSGAVRLAMLESATLAIFGCIVAVPLSWGAARILSRVIQSVHGFDAFPTVTPSISLLSISIGITLVIACVMSAGANIWFGKRREGISLKEVCSATGTRSRNWIIGFEVFTSVILITVAVVNGIGSLKLDRQPSGFATDNAVMASLDLKAAIHGAPASPGLEEHIVENIEQSPGVQSIASINVLPLSGAEAKGTIRSRIESGMMRQEDIWPADVSLEYFSTIGTAIIKGRDFAREDFAGTPVCIVSNRFASSTFSGDDTLGKYLYEGGDDATNAAPIPYCRIIGVAEDVHFRSMSDSPDTVVYRLSKSLFPNIIVRAVNSGLAIQAVRNAVKSVAPDSLTPRIETIQEHMEDDLRLTRVIALSAAICAFISAIVLSIGFFGILSLQVAEQRRKIGIQIALGANRTQICISVMNKLRQSILAGLAFGSGAALLAATEVAQNYGLGSGNVIGGFLGGLFTLGVLLLASAIAPLRRAFAVSPMECLRSE